MVSKRVHVLLNPVAGGGRASKLWPKLLPDIKQKFGNDYSLHFTCCPNDATNSARKAITSGAKIIIAIGGDGTVQETVNGFFQDRKLINPSCDLGIVNCGTGSGLAQTLNLPTSPRQQLDLICHHSSCAIDVGHITYRDKNGRKLERFFVSECQMGIGGAVVAQVSAMHKHFGGTFAFGSVAITQTLSFKALQMTVRLDNNEKMNKKLIGVVIGNGIYCGGGMKLTPAAKPNDGQLDVLLIHDMNLLSRLWNFPKIYSGKHVDSQYFASHQSRKISVDSQESVLVEADGELLGTVPCEIDVFPAALRVICNLS